MDRGQSRRRAAAGTGVLVLCAFGFARRTVAATRLAQCGIDRSTTGAGRRNELSPLSPRHAASDHTRISAAEVDANRAALDNKPVEIDVTQVRDSSSNPSLFPAGTDKNNFTAYSVTAAEGETRTRLAIVVRDDTDASKQIRRSLPTDRLRVRGSAHLTSGSSGLSIVVDEVEAVEAAGN